MAYARLLSDRLGDRLQFAAVNPLGVYGRLDRKAAVAFLERTERRWVDNRPIGRWSLRATAVRDLLSLWPRIVPKARTGVRRYLVQASPNHLHDRKKVLVKLDREGARFLCLVFDLIPIEFPEYARPDGAAKHLARVKTMAETADGLITISAAVARSIEPYLAKSDNRPQVRPILLGVDVPRTAPELPAKIDVARPYFVVVSTIEPRKNHLLLLQIWRSMVEKLGPEKVPHLVVVGRRGWENENIVDMLERCVAIAQNVTELSGLSDEALFPLMAGARALLFPSFAEGFGLPIAEALSLGTPVICSELPVLREAGADIPDYIDPLDGLGWTRAILDYAAEDSAARARQLDRMNHWNPPSWDQHIDGVLALLSDIDRDVR